MAASDADGYQVLVVQCFLLHLIFESHVQDNKDLVGVLGINKVARITVEAQKETLKIK